MEVAGDPGQVANGLEKVVGHVVGEVGDELDPLDAANLVQPGEQVDLVSLWEDGRERRVSGFRLVPYDVPQGQAAAYYPETNPLVPLESYGDRTYTPTSKFIAIKLEKARAGSRIAAAIEAD